MTIRKRTTRKTGNSSRRTTTLSSTGGKTESYSNKPSKSGPRRTISFNHKTGKTRTTYSQKLGGGFTKITSKTTGGRQNYKSSKRSEPLTFTGFFILLLLGVLLVVWPVSVPYIIGGVLAIGALVVLSQLFIFLLPYIIIGSILYTSFTLWNQYGKYIT